MSLANYAILDNTQTVIVDFETMDTASFAAFPLIKSQCYRIVTMTSQPAFNPATQMVVQNGWTINANDVEPIWVIQALTALQQQQFAATQNWNTQLAANLIADFTTYSAVAVPSQAQTTAVVRQLVKCVSALLQHQYGVFN